MSEVPAATGLIHALIDRLASDYAQEQWRAEIAAAREDYFTRAGKVMEDDQELFEARVASFLEWYVVERPLAGGPPPIMRALEAAVREPPETRLALAHLATSSHSLFDVVAVSEHSVELEDVLGGARYLVVERRSTAGFHQGDIAEARVIWDGLQVVFGKTFLFHPRDARDEALAAIEAAAAKGTDREEIMFQLSRLHVRWHRHGHVGAARVYRGGA